MQVMLPPTARVSRETHHLSAPNRNSQIVGLPEILAH